MSTGSAGKAFYFADTLNLWEKFMSQYSVTLKKILSQRTGYTQPDFFNSGPSSYNFSVLTLEQGRALNSSVGLLTGKKYLEEALT